MENYDHYIGEDTPEHPDYKEKDIKVFDVKFRGIDDWNRPVFKVVDKSIYFGSVEILVPDKKLGLVDKDTITEYFRNNPNYIEFFGGSFNCEPHGGFAANWKLNILD